MTTKMLASWHEELADLELRYNNEDDSTDIAADAIDVLRRLLDELERTA